MPDLRHPEFRHADPRYADLWAWGQWHRAKPDHRARERAGRAGRAAGRGRGDDQRLVAAVHEMLGHAEGAVATPLTSGGKDSATIAIRTFTNVNYEVSP